MVLMMAPMVGIFWMTLKNSWLVTTIIFIHKNEHLYSIYFFKLRSFYISRIESFQSVFYYWISKNWSGIFQEIHCRWQVEILIAKLKWPKVQVQSKEILLHCDHQAASIKVECTGKYFYIHMFPSLFFVIFPFLNLSLPPLFLSFFLSHSFLFCLDRWETSRWWIVIHHIQRRNIQLRWKKRDAPRNTSKRSFSYPRAGSKSFATTRVGHKDVWCPKILAFECRPRIGHRIIMDLGDQTYSNHTIIKQAVINVEP